MYIIQKCPFRNLFCSRNLSKVILAKVVLAKVVLANVVLANKVLAH